MVEWQTRNLEVVVSFKNRRGGSSPLLPMSILYCAGWLAQLVERYVYTVNVIGSIPIPPIFILYLSITSL